MQFPEAVEKWLKEERLQGATQKSAQTGKGTWTTQKGAQTGKGTGRHREAPRQEKGCGEATVEVRQSEDGGWYTKAELVQFWGLRNGPKQWWRARETTTWRRMTPEEEFPLLC